MNEVQVKAQFAELVAQRTNALNTCVNLVGEMAVLREEIAALQAQVATLKGIAEAASDATPTPA